LGYGRWHLWTYYRNFFSSPFFSLRPFDWHVNNHQTASEKPFLDLTIIPNGQSALATSTDRIMTLYDLRTSALTSSTGSFLFNLQSSLKHNLQRRRLPH
jgi:hypothetical protein